MSSVSVSNDDLVKDDERSVTKDDLIAPKLGGEIL